MDPPFKANAPAPAPQPSAIMRGCALAFERHEAVAAFSSVEFPPSKSAPDQRCRGSSASQSSRKSTGRSGRASQDRADEPFSVAA